MNPNERNKANNQADYGANEKGKPGSKGKTSADAPLDHTYPQGASQQRGQGPTRQGGDGVHQSNDLAGGYPKSPGGANKLAADEKMDDDTGFSNKP